jgi:hypothetical protein
MSIIIIIINIIINAIIINAIIIILAIIAKQLPFVRVSVQHSWPHALRQHEHTVADDQSPLRRLPTAHQHLAPQVRLSRRFAARENADSRSCVPWDVTRRVRKGGGVMSGLVCSDECQRLNHFTVRFLPRYISPPLNRCSKKNREIILSKPSPRFFLFASLSFLFFGSSYRYLPDVPDGREALELLKRSFKLGHSFMVGTSVTTGTSNSVVWGGIHQKTSTSGGAAQHGWPDPTYFDRLRAECAAKGITTKPHTPVSPAATAAAAAAAATSAAATSPASASSSAAAADTPIMGVIVSSSSSSSSSAAHTSFGSQPVMVVATVISDGTVSSNGGGSSVSNAVVLNPAIAALDAQIAQKSAEVQAAMSAQDMSSVRRLMGERKQLMEAKAAALS